ncbi:cytochrome b [Pararobbsia silviterrae]|uniref:Cytochrome b n=1 Tax=Pararobbsia silviterrae TaxID=1792498 RepID=A0A494XZA8_9BURK|nr:cytochrome b [Pararobbsia silviterrae]RKP55894.1 cytochrome b [Pararobbsia silviterrae]
MNSTPHFSGAQRLLHWTMAVAIVAMLFIGAGMVETVSERHRWLIAIHKPLGIAILVLALIRIAVRLRKGAPPLPADLPGVQRLVAHLSHLVLYGLMIAMPLLGWAMVSAGGYPVTLIGGWRLPPIAPADAWWFARLHLAHTYLAYLLFLTVLGHLGAALFHGLVRRDGVLSSMATSGR